MDEDLGRPGGLSSDGSSQPVVSPVPASIPDAVCEHCYDPDEPSISYYPMYGVAPHECYWRKGPEFTLGQSTLKPFSPEDCFVPDLEDDEDWGAFQYPSACGVYYCPNCQHEEYQRAWQALVLRIGEPPDEVTAHQHLHAQAIEAGTGETERLDPQGESAVRKDAPKTPENNQ